MGPRSHERGNRFTIKLELRRVLMNAEPAPANRRTLQWGRVLMNAETRLPIVQCGVLMNAETPRITMLQWGRVLMNAETPWAAARRERGHPSCFNGAAFS